MTEDLKDFHRMPETRDEAMSALFANLVLQQTNLAMLCLGQVEHPESGRRVVDFESARLLIDQLEMLKEKTRGNLTTEEDKLLTESLTSLKMVFVEMINNTGVEAPQSILNVPDVKVAQGKTESSASQAQQTSQQTSDASQDKASQNSPAKEEPHKRFSKRY
jgi:hypothetical protein